MEGAPLLKVYERGTFPSIQSIYKGTGLDLKVWPPCQKESMHPSPWSFEQICSLRNKNFCLTILWDQVAFFTVSPQSGWGSQLANFTSMHGSGLDIKMTEKQILTSKWPICLVYVIKVLDLVAFLSLSLSLPPFFPWWTSAIMSNLDQSYFKKVNVLITLEVKRADIMSGHLGIWPDKTYFDRTLSVDQPLFQALKSCRLQD